MPIPFVDLKAQYARLKPNIATRLNAVLDHGQYIMGPEIGELEKTLSKFGGDTHCISVASGTTALQMALMVEEIGEGDAVFVPAFTFPATAEVILAVGATPIFVDVEERSFNIDPEALDAAAREVKQAGKLKPKALLAVDLFGQPADYRRLNPICQKHEIVVIADAAQSFGGRLDNIAVGALAPMTATSFFPAKPLGCYGDGGAVFTNDAKRAEILRSIRVHGGGGEKYDIVRLGLNGRLDTLQAAILLAKLDIFADEIAARERVAQRYDSGLSKHVTTPARLKGSQSAWAQYALLLKDRDRVKQALGAKQIPTQVYYPRPLHMQTAYQPFGRGPGSLPVSQSLCNRVLCLPMHPYLDNETVDTIVDAVKAAL